MKKQYLVEGFFPEAASFAADQSCRQTASKLSIAMKRGVEELLRRNGVRKKHIRTVKVVVRQIETGTEKRK